jgi:hypothetical protein
MPEKLQPVEEWLEVWRLLQESARAENEGIALDALAGAVLRLYWLMEPPSVRAARVAASS